MPTKSGTRPTLRLSSWPWRVRSGRRLGFQLEVLAVCSRWRRSLLFAGGDGGVAFDQRRRNSAQRFDTQRRGRDVQQQNVFHFRRRRTPPCTRRAYRDDFVGVHTAVRFLAEQVTDDLLDSGDAGRASHQNYFVDLGGLHSSIGQSLFAGLNRAVQNIGHHLFEAGTGQFLDQVLATGLIGG